VSVGAIIVTLVRHTAIVVIAIGLCLVLPQRLAWGGFDNGKVSTIPTIDLPLELTISSQKQIYTSREGIMIRMNFLALQPVDLCLQKDPLSQFDITIFRSGLGPLRLKPMVVQDNSVLFAEKTRVFHLNPGDNLPYRANLKRVHFARNDGWEAGDYTVSVNFHLCDPTVGKKIRENPFLETNTLGGKEGNIPSLQPARFMIME
jgi:hypothetical protein